MAKAKPNPREAVARSIRALMADSPDLRTQAALARRARMSQSTVGRILRMEVDPQSENLKRIADALGVPVDRLYAETEARREFFGRTANISPVAAVFKNVPLISKEQAGRWAEIMDNFQPGDAEAWLLCPVSCSPRTFALRVEGASMEPSYQHGDLIFVDPAKPADGGALVVVRRLRENEVTFKQLVVEGDRKYLRALNPDWPGPRIIALDSRDEIAGVIIGKWVNA